MIPRETVADLSFINEFALAFIAIAAGAELNLSEVAGYFKSIVAIIVGQTVAVMALGILAFVMLAGSIPFMQQLGPSQVLAVAVLGATIMVARSPSSALAIIKELRARGPFTQKVLGATVLKDAVVIVIFAASVSVAAVLVEGEPFDVGLLVFIVFEIILDIVLGLGLGGSIVVALSSSVSALVKGLIVLLLGYGVFLLADVLHEVQLPLIPLNIFSEPLLICMVAGFTVANFSAHRTELQRIVERVGPAVFVLFFTLVGAQLELDVLQATWAVALVLIVVRFAGIFVGSLTGGVVAGDPMKQNMLFGMTFITQAGVSIGLAREIAAEFPPWGNELATLSIAVIVVNQIVGPPFFKWAVHLVGEAHRREDFDGSRDTVIFGLERQSLALARQLQSHDWGVRVVATDRQDIARVIEPEMDIRPIDEITVETLRELELQKADSVVIMLPDDEALELCRLLTDYFDLGNVIARITDRANAEAFAPLRVTIVEPSTAIVELLEHLVRSPSGVKLLLGMEGTQDVVDVEVRNRHLFNKALRELSLPLDALILSVRRDDQVIISHGYTRLRPFDQVTIVGSRTALEEVVLLFEGLEEPAPRLDSASAEPGRPAIG